MLFRLEGVKYRHVLEIPALSIPEGQITCVVGESGSGKTTLLRLLNNLLSPDQGRILYRGQNIEALDPVWLRRRVVMLAQTPTIFPGTVEENLRLGLELAGATDKPRAELEAALATVQLSKPLDAAAEQLSGGEKQRLALARVLLLAPEALLLDEPSASLDEETERMVIEGVVSFARSKGGTCVMVTHSRAVADAFADEVVVVRGGRATKVKGRADYA